jgi:transcriptional regulator GlxA family with amidase domain
MLINCANMLYVCAMLSSQLSIGIIPMPDFTMIALAGFVDALRLAADEGDRSRQIRIRWTLLSEDRQPVTASNAIQLRPEDTLTMPERFDYIVVVGGTLHRGPFETPALVAFLRAADAANIPLIGLCTGSFTLARAGLMEKRKVCVNWFHHDDYQAEFPNHHVVSDQLFVDDGQRLTCAGGVSVIHVATLLVDRHLGVGAGDKGRRIMLEERARAGETPQPLPPGLSLSVKSDPRVRRAILYMERQLAEPIDIAMLSNAAGASRRTLGRLFESALGMTPMAALRELRLHRAQYLLDSAASLPLHAIAAECGFSDASHLSRTYRNRHGKTPRERGRRTK